MPNLQVKILTPETVEGYTRRVVKCELTRTGDTGKFGLELVAREAILEGPGYDATLPFRVTSVNGRSFIIAIPRKNGEGVYAVRVICPQGVSPESVRKRLYREVPPLSPMPRTQQERNGQREAEGPRRLRIYVRPDGTTRVNVIPHQDRTTFTASTANGGTDQAVNHSSRSPLGARILGAMSPELSLPTGEDDTAIASSGRARPRFDFVTRFQTTLHEEQQPVAREEGLALPPTKVVEPIESKMEATAAVGFTEKLSRPKRRKQTTTNTSSHVRRQHKSQSALLSITELYELTVRLEIRVNGRRLPLRVTKNW